MVDTERFVGERGTEGVQVFRDVVLQIGVVPLLDDRAWRRTVVNLLRSRA